MLCLNPDCGSLNASEVNLSWNVSECVAGVAATEYTGTTDYGDTSPGLGTWCPDCEQTQMAHIAISVVLRMMPELGDLITPLLAATRAGSTDRTLAAAARLLAATATDVDQLTMLATHPNSWVRSAVSDRMLALAGAAA